MLRSGIETKFDELCTPGNEKMAARHQKHNMVALLFSNSQFFNMIVLNSLKSMQSNTLN